MLLTFIGAYLLLLVFHHPSLFHSRGLGPDLQNILRQSYDYLTIMPMLRSTYDGRLIYKTSYEGSKAILRYDSLAKL